MDFILIYYEKPVLGVEYCKVQKTGYIFNILVNNIVEKTAGLGSKVLFYQMRTTF